MEGNMATTRITAFLQSFSFVLFLYFLFLLCLKLNIITCHAVCTCVCSYSQRLQMSDHPRAGGIGIVSCQCGYWKSNSGFSKKCECS